MTLMVPWSTTPEHRNTILQLFERSQSISGQDVRDALECSSAAAHLVLEDLMGVGLIQAQPAARGITRYLRRHFEHPSELVHAEWFHPVLQLFQHGKQETVFSTAQQLVLPLPEVRATLEEMRKQGLLFGHFIGSMCVYSSRRSQVTFQSDVAQG
ncbi:hypothetical protein [Deinococcus misasensis]|uniref:hypothetical protein n=1 Tax=Deinococcus misasensis TaxID=392413 RepID=UPI0005559348|nr:hypothetical protein [Deinococcus misasensis]